MGRIGAVELVEKSGGKLAETESLLRDFCKKSRSIERLFAEVTPVMAEIGGGTASGAVTLYRAKKIKVESNLPGGVQEIAESIIFELLNWKSGDFVSFAHGQVKNGVISPK